MERFPCRPPRLSMTEKDIWYDAGRQSLIEFLREQYTRQQEARLDRPVINLKQSIKD